MNVPKVSTKSLRSLVSKVQPSILTGAINESADYIDELEKEIERLAARDEKLNKIIGAWIHIEENGTKEEADDFYTTVQDILSNN